MPPSAPAPQLPGPARGLLAAGAARRIEGSRVLRLLEDLHSGHVGDYTAWLLAGVIGIGGFMAAVETGR